MAKGDDAIRKKRNKANRKKQNKDPATVTARIASIIAAKKRRKAGNRRMCEGMCFSLPTPDDPFNDRFGKKDTGKKEFKKRELDRHVSAEDKISAIGKVVPNKNNSKINHLEKEARKCKLALNDGSYPSKYLLQCLRTIQYALGHTDSLGSEVDRPFFASTWGIEFWKCYSNGRDILETSGSSSTVQQIAWIVSTASDAIARQEAEGPSVSNPFLLYLVPTQEAASKVRSICMPLKKLGIHAVCLHTGATLDHQIHGLKSCEPEFLLATPERLLELVCLKALDISEVSFLVVDGLEALCGHLDAIKSIRKSISGDSITMVFNDYMSHSSTPGIQNLLTGPISRLSLNDSIDCQSAYITQSVHVCSFEEQKMLKGIQILHQARDHISVQLLKVLLVVSNDNNFQDLATSLKSNGYSVSMDSTIYNSFKNENRKAKPEVTVIEMEQTRGIDIGGYELVIILDFTHSVHNYVHILTNMARHSVNGTLHSMMTEDDASMARPLIQVLEQCKQPVPEAVTNLCCTPMLEH